MVQGQESMTECSSYAESTHTHTPSFIQQQQQHLPSLEMVQEQQAYHNATYDMLISREHTVCHTYTSTTVLETMVL